VGDKPLTRRVWIQHQITTYETRLHLFTHYPASKTQTAQAVWPLRLEAEETDIRPAQVDVPGMQSREIFLIRWFPNARVFEMTKPYTTLEYL